MKGKRDLVYIKETCKAGKLVSCKPFGSKNTDFMKIPFFWLKKKCAWLAAQHFCSAFLTEKFDWIKGALPCLFACFSWLFSNKIDR